jgi:hypothetical protein
MTIQTSVDRVRRREATGRNPEIGFESLAAVLMMSSIGLTLSLLIITLVAS